MYYAYVLKSVHHDYWYKGHYVDVQTRLNQDNSGMTQSIRPYIPFKLVYFESFSTEKEAIEREQYFKSAAGRRYLKKILVR